MLRKLGLLCVTLALLLTVGTAAFAGAQTLSINANDENAVWFVSGEASLIMNGFDLSSFGVALPAVIDQVSISVSQAVPGQPIEVVVYQDANGGSPIDATLAGRTTVDITGPGVFTATFPQPITITQNAVWAGFYLPVDFNFIADTSGTSVLTYWAWTPGARFDVANLATASVLGPADGTAPANIDMQGRARITVGITSGTTPATTGITQTTGGAANISVMATYPACQALLWDTADEQISLGDEINLHCREVSGYLAPANPLGFGRRGPLYDVVMFKPGGVVPQRLRAAVTHCIRPPAEDLASAVIGVTVGAPRTWLLLPTQRFGDL
ncbi:MAG TPA: hypothetical protein VER79_14495, partial [Candidatus Limnocylindrales bacterium]|nr:hypothetical protein [Candidatus Limnocylindrales bacterium]